MRNMKSIKTIEQYSHAYYYYLFIIIIVIYLLFTYLHALLVSKDIHVNVLFAKTFVKV